MDSTRFRPCPTKKSTDATLATKASIAHNLRAYLGDELFRSGMQSVLAELYDSYMDAAQFEATLEEVTGVDMTLWFEAQVLQPGFSTWVLDSAVTAGAQQSLHLQQKLRACDNYHMSEPLDVAVGRQLEPVRHRNRRKAKTTRS